jgi:tetratricopeptide (TPR) repeat protein
MKTLNLMLLILFGFNALAAQEYENYTTILDTSIASKHLGFDKNISITVPFEWQDGLERTFPLIIIFDSQNQRSHGYILNTIDYLTSNDQMPSSIIVSIESEEKYRYLETLHSESNEKGLAGENEAFIFDELIPLAEKKFKASSFRLFIGHSRYGYFTTSLFCSRINELNGVISLSPVFEQKNVNLCDSIVEVGAQDLNFSKYYRFGIGSDYPEDYSKMDSTLQTFNNPMLETKGMIFKEAYHNVTPGLVIGTALYDIFEYWSEMQNTYFSNDQTDLSIISDLDDMILAHYGCPLPFSLGVLNGKGWFFYNEKEYEKAIEAWEILMEYYPNYSEGYLYIIDAKMELNQDLSSSIEDFKASLLKSNLYTENEKNELRQLIENINK